MFAGPKRHSSVKEERFEGIQACKSKLPGDLRRQKVNSELLRCRNTEGDVMGRPATLEGSLPRSGKHPKLHLDVGLPHSHHKQLI